jgi:hypothetical protein
MSTPLRRRHTFGDFLGYMLVGLLPVVLACYAIGASRAPWLAGYVVLMLLLGVAEVGCLCRHCPYYAQQPGATVHCKYLWGPAKWFKPKPGPLSALDKAILYSFFFLSFSYPIYWLAREPILLAAYLWSIAIMVSVIARHECTRCMHFHCTFNMVSDDAKKDSLPGDEH